MFREIPPLERFAAARLAGFDKVEVQVLEAPPADMLHAMRQTGVGILLLNVGMGDFIKGGPGLIGMPGREEEFRTEFDKTLETALALEIPFIHLGPGRVPEGTAREACLATLRGNAAKAIQAARGKPVTLLLEPQNAEDIPNVLLGDIDKTAMMIREEFAGELWLMFDIYHIARNGQNILEAFQRNADLVKHIQFSDSPGRHEPGTGNIDFASVFTGIQNAGYGGWYGAEYFPSAVTGESFAWLANFRPEQAPLP